MFSNLLSGKGRHTLVSRFRRIIGLNSNNTSTLPFTALLVISGFVFAAPAFAAGPNIVEGTGCVVDQPAYTQPNVNCTAGDLGLSSPVVTVIDACDYPGDTATLQVLVDITTTAQTRYDMGLWFSIDGDPNGDGSATGECTVVTVPKNLINADGDLTDVDGDFCGDIENTNAGPPDVVNANLGVFDLPCIDNNGDGLIDIPLIVAYSNSASDPNDPTDDGYCASPTDAVPQTKSKCSENLDTNIPVPVPAQIIVTKDTVPDNPADFNFNLSGPAIDPLPAGGFDGSHDFTLADTEQFDSAVFTGGLTAGAGYSVTETPNANYQSSGVCSSNVDGTNTDPNNLTLRAGETVTCDFTNTALGTVAIIKKTIGNPVETFDFTSPDLNNGFAITTVGGTGSEDLTGLQTGTYVITEIAKTGWVLTDLFCVGGTTTVDKDTRTVEITLAGQDTVSCTFENTELGQIEILKSTVPVSTDTFSFAHDAVGGNVPPPTFSFNAGGSVLFHDVVPGTILVEELDPNPEYDLAGLECVDGDPTGTQSTWSVATRVSTINLDPGELVTCTYTNTKRANLTLVKTVTNDNGGTAGPTSWTLSAAGTTPLSGLSGQPAVTDVDVVAGDYILAETGGPSGYTAGSWSCPGAVLNGSTVTLAPGQVVTCTINNDDNPASLTLIKDLTNDNGGTAVEADWTLSAGSNDVTGSAAGAVATTTAGTYALSESTVAGYTNTSITCDNVAGPVTSVTVGVGETVACTFVNDDDPAILTLVKTVTNNNGGTAQPTEWTLSAAGPTSISGQTGTAAVTAVPVDAGIYTLSESGGPTGYNAGLWSCSAGTLNVDQLTLANGVSATCTINNNDEGPGLTLIKAVTNDNGGTLGPADFALHLTGGAYDGSQTFASGSAPLVDAGIAYTLSETPEPGYTEKGVVCIDDDTLADVGHPVTLNLRQAVTCTIRNDDDAASLALVKSVTNDNGGTAVAADWTLSAAGPTPISGAGGVAATPVSAGTYALSESAGPAGYTAGAWSCAGGTLTGSSLVLALGETAVCTIVNNDDAASLALVKTVTNTNGGTAVATDWTLAASGPTPLSGAGGVAATPVSAGTYTLSESGGPTGYTAGAWSCTAGTLTGDSLVLALGETAVCTIGNFDAAASLALVKQVTNDNGGTAVATDWTLAAAGPTPLSGAGGVPASPVSAGTYTLSESGGSAGYTAGAWSCTGGTLTGDSLLLALGQSAVCTIVNNDDAASLALVKQVTNDNGGTAVPTDWTLAAAGPTPLSGVGGVAATPVSAGTYTLSESGGPAGYTAGAWSCTGGILTGDSLVLALGQTAVCTIINDDDAAARIDIEKATNGEDADDAPGPTIALGGNVNWTYEVTNTGNVRLDPVTVSDDKVTDVTCPQTALDPGESMTCTASGSAKPGQYENTGTATGTISTSGPTQAAADANTVTDQDMSHYFGEVTPVVEPAPVPTLMEWALILLSGLLALFAVPALRRS